MSDTTNAGHCGHECRMLPIESCYECNNRLEMKELYKPYGMIPVPSGNDISDFCGRYVCTASDDKEIKNYLGAFPKWCPLPNGTRKQPSAEHDAAIRKEAYEQGVKDGRETIDYLDAKICERKSELESLFLGTSFPERTRGIIIGLLEVRELIQNIRKDP